MGYGNAGTAIEQYPSKSADRTPMIAIEMDRQSKALSHLHSVISDLDSRLTPVMRLLGPEVTSASRNDAKAPAAVPFAGNLSEQNGQIEGACARLTSILERIEL